MHYQDGHPALFIFILQNTRSEATRVLSAEIIFLIDSALSTNINSFIQQIVLGNTVLTESKSYFPLMCILVTKMLEFHFGFKMTRSLVSLNL